jgi:AAA15 family ATPase/GTPase
MLTRVELKNYGPLRNLVWENLGTINLVIGGNGSGKTFLLKALYTVVRSLEEYGRGNDPRHLSDILTEKLYWTFQPEKIGNLVTKGSESPLLCRIELGDIEYLEYAFGKGTSRQISDIEWSVCGRESNSVFLPAKEVLSLHKIILKSRDVDKTFGFDDTYLDLARALQLYTRAGEMRFIPAEFALSRKHLEEIIDGKVTYDEASDRWEYRKGNARFAIGATAEGVKKIAILDTLLSNGYLSRESIVFIDEPESALHPEAISKFLDIIAVLARSGIQFFLASHSYFVLKKLLLIALENEMSIPVIAANGDAWHSFDLRDGLPENAIINESIRLYREELELALS